MDLRQFRYFVAVAEELSFTRAARRLGIGQPPLSQQIQQLEREVGAQLFARLPRGVALTAAGQRLLHDAKDILARSERAMRNAGRAARGELGVLQVGFTASAAFNPFVTASIRDYRESFPGVQVELVEAHTTELLERFRTRRLDAAFLRPAPGECGALPCTPLLREPMLVALPAGHALAARRSLPMAALRDEAFLLYPRRNGRALYDAIVSGCEAAGFTPRISQEAPQMASTVTLVASGLGIAIVPASMGQLLAEGVTYRPLEGPAPCAELSLAHQTETAQEVTARFVRLVLARPRPDLAEPALARPQPARPQPARH
ncbi:LysR family transcriptional regulator [Roseomonas sp. GC11]|uniref:LysR family transcriptional regulator n=1 Tax=Roseomonas sp. GC11 TaxID=2950546 RepID=UPI002108CD60|nr:LysR family transcriptional regulator [Roseomonas sp. GC11]MCQ4161617.1 LysR family transcriptional regulator [Roseomonas sp. GC11]